MKKISVSVLFIVFSLVCSILTASSYGKNYWEWSTSESASEFVNSLTNKDDGILLENFPVKSWTIKVVDKKEFNEILSKRGYLKNFVAKRVSEVCMANQFKEDSCNSAKKFLQKAWVVENDCGHLASYELAVNFYKVDYDNWFSFNRVQMKIAKYLEANYGTRLLRLFKGFKHNGILSKGGISIVDLPVVIDTAEQTITFYSASLYD